MADHEALPSNFRFIDALDRAWRTFYTLVGVDLLFAIGTGLTQLVNEGDPFTGAFWSTLLILVVKSILAAAASFLLRYAKQPKVAQVPELN